MRFYTKFKGTFRVESSDIVLTHRTWCYHFQVSRSANSCFLSISLPLNRPWPKAINNRHICLLGATEQIPISRLFIQSTALFAPSNICVLRWQKRRATWDLFNVLLLVQNFGAVLRLLLINKHKILKESLLIYNSSSPCTQNNVKFDSVCKNASVHLESWYGTWRDLIWQGT